VIKTGRPLVIGYGNPLREDDGMGWRAAELLSEQLSPDAAEVIQCQQLTPELADKVEGASLVVFLDAACDQHAGTVLCEPVTGAGNSAWSHHLSPAQLLRLSEELGNAPRPAFLVRGGALRMDLGDHLTSVGEKTAIEMARLAQALLRESSSG
jgi:hydrogenase maturation protease